MSSFAPVPTPQADPFGRALHDDDWCLFRVARPNVLLIGPDVDTRLAVASITRWGRERVGFWTPEARPFNVSQFETLVVRHVTDLDWAEQVRLNDLMAEWSDAVRVIATSRTAPYGLVTRKRFLEALYYRLNVVCLDAHDMHTSEADVSRR